MNGVTQTGFSIVVGRWVALLTLLVLLGLHTIPSLAAKQTSILPPLLNFLLDSEPRFGARRVDESHRPSRDWLRVFDGVAPIELVGSLQDTIDDCSEEEGAVCVIEIGELELDETIYIYRPNIKLIGKNQNKITYTGVGSIFWIGDGARNIVIGGLDIDGRVNGKQIDRDPNIFAVYVEAESQSISNLLIKDNYIHHVHGYENAHAIGVWGHGETEGTAITGVIIENNQLENLRTGTSESIAVNGNVKNWEIVGNTITDINNIAIDAIGGEGTSPTVVVNGRELPGRLDAARLGFIQNNRVSNMSLEDNPQYGDDIEAASIYIDGARDIVVSGNIVENSDWAFDIGAENCVQVSDILVEHNQASGSWFGDFLIGGYSKGGYLDNTAINCVPSDDDEDEGHGYVYNVTVKNNAFDSVPGDPDRDVNIAISNRVRNTIIVQNHVNPVNEDGVVGPDENSIRTSE